MNNLIRNLTAFPFFRWLRYGALAVFFAALCLFAFTSFQWETKRSVFVFAIPLGFLVNSLSVEILLHRLRKDSR